MPDGDRIQEDSSVTPLSYAAGLLANGNLACCWINAVFIVHDGDCEYRSELQRYRNKFVRCYPKLASFPSRRRSRRSIKVGSV